MISKEFSQFPSLHLKWNYPLIVGSPRLLLGIQFLVFFGDASYYGLQSFSVFLRFMKKTTNLKYPTWACACTSYIDTGGEKNLYWAQRAALKQGSEKKEKKKEEPSIMLLAWQCHVWTPWLWAGLRACSAAHYRTLEVTREKKDKEKKNEAPFQPVDDCSLLAEIERIFVKHAKSDEGSVFTGRWTAAGRADNGGKKKVIMGREGEGCLRGQAKSWESSQKEKQER